MSWKRGQINVEVSPLPGPAGGVAAPEERGAGPGRVERVALENELRAHTP